MNGYVTKLGEGRLHKRVRCRNLAILLGFLMAVGIPGIATAAEYYIAADGSSYDGDGSISNPWDIAVLDDGLVIIEANGWTDFAIFQLKKPLLMDPRIRAFYEYHGVV